MNIRSVVGSILLAIFVAVNSYAARGGGHAIQGKPRSENSNYKKYDPVESKRRYGPAYKITPKPRSENSNYRKYDPVKSKLRY